MRGLRPAARTPDDEPDAFTSSLREVIAATVAQADPAVLTAVSGLSAACEDDDLTLLVLPDLLHRHESLPEPVYVPDQCRCAPWPR